MDASIDGKFIESIESEKVNASDLDFFAANPAFVERPVPVRHFVEQPKYLNSPETWPEVKNILGSLFKGSKNGKRFSPYREFVFDAGIGSGKSFIVSHIFTYITYWLLCLTDPQKHFGLAPRSIICLINTSTTASQAKKVVFGQVKARVDLSPWFQKHYPPSPRIKSELRFPKDIVIFPGSSSETAPIGYNVIAANVDEASFFDETDTKSSANEVFDVLDRRIDSRFGDRGLMAVTSSPRYVDDFTEQKYEESRINKRIVGYRRATWQMRPDDIAAVESGDYFELAPSGSTETLKIPKKYENAFTKNPAKAWRDFGARASLVLESYFDENEIQMLEALIKGSSIPPSVVDGKINPLLQPIPGVGYHIHVDLGLSRDCCGVAMAHIEDRENAVIDLILRIASHRRAQQLMDKQQPIDMILGMDQVDLGGFDPEPYGVLGIISDLAERGFFIQMVTFDNFQSVHSRQQLERRGFMADLLSVDRDTSAYDTLKTTLRSGRLKCPPHPWFLHEGKRLELVKGKKVDHPPGGSKDLMDAGAGAVKSAFDQFDEQTQAEETIADDEINRVDISPEI